MNKKFSIIISVLFLTCFLCVLIPPASPQTNFETIYTLEKSEINESNAKTYLTSTHSIQPDVDEKFSLYNRGSKYVSLTSDSYSVIVEKITNGYEYTLVVNSPISLKENSVKFEVDTKGYTVTQDGSLRTELPKKDYKVWNETYAFDGQNETRKDISLVGCLRFIPDGKITEEFIIKRPFIYDANLVGVFGTQKLEGNTLTVSIPQEFLSNARFPIFVDPTYIFCNGFESGDFSAWTGTTIGVASSLNTTDTQKHCGTYSLAGYNAGSETAEVYKSISASETVYMRGYFRFTALPAPGNLIALIGMTGTLDRQLSVSLYNLGGTMNFQVAAFAAYTDYGTIGSLETGVWYCIEAKFYANANGSVQVWLDGVEKFCSSGDDLSGRGNINAVRVGNGVDGKDSTIESTINIDCVVVSDSYIGLEDSMPTPTPTATVQPTSTPLPTNEEGFGVFELLLLTAILVVINIVGLGFRVPLLNLVSLIFSFTFIIIFEVSNMSILLIAINCLVSVACLTKNLYGRKS